MRRLILAFLIAVSVAGALPSAVAATPGRGGHSTSPGSLGAITDGSITGLAGNLVSPATGAGNPVNLLRAGTNEAASVALGGFASGVLGGASSALQESAHVISRITAPRLRSTWFSGTYWRVAGLGGLLSLPFLFAAAAQALLRADPLLLARAVFGYLPLAVLAVSLAAPITMLLLSATDEMSSVVAGAGMGGGVHFLRQTADAIVGLSALDGSPVLGIAVGLLTLAAAVALAVELLIREAAVYVVVLMLPLAFAALIWPARRSWVIRLIELLIALILSKFVIVAVLSLAGAAYGSSGFPTLTRLLTAMTLVLLSTFAPWVMLRLLPFTEVAAGAAGGIRGEVSRLRNIPIGDAAQGAESLVAWAESLPQLLRRQAGEPDADDPQAAEGASGNGSRDAAGAAAVTQGMASLPEQVAAGESGQPGNAGVRSHSAGPPPTNGGPPDERESSSLAAGPGTRRRGPFAEMEPMWQFEDLTPNWMALDGEGIHRVGGGDPASGPLAPDPLCRNPLSPDPLSPDLPSPDLPSPDSEAGPGDGGPSDAEWDRSP